MSDAPQVQVVATEEAAEDGSVLADAAVASAALSGAAVVEAGHAGEEARVADAKADAALASAAQAQANAVTEERVKQLVSEGISQSNAELAAALAKVQQPAQPVEAEVVVEEAPKEDVAPASFKPQKRKTIAERYRGA